MERLTDETFEEAVNSETLILIEFGAEWCGPCKTQKPILEKLEEKFQFVKFFEMDMDDCPETSNTLGIKSLPTIKVFSNGLELKSFVGLTKHDVLKDYLNNV